MGRRQENVVNEEHISHVSNCGADSMGRMPNSAHCDTEQLMKL